MGSEITYEDIFRWLLDGKKIRVDTWLGDNYIELKNGKLVDQNRESKECFFDAPWTWSLYEEEKPKWYRVSYQIKGREWPMVLNFLFKSKEDFLKKMDMEKEEFEFFAMEEVVNQLENN